MQADELDKLIQTKIGNALAKVFVNGEFQGTGFFITPDGYILTAYHCIGDYAGDIIIETYFDGKHRAWLDKDKSLRDLKKYDIAVLKIDYSAKYYLPLGLLANPQQAKSDQVIAMGYPGGHKRPESEHGIYTGNISKFQDTHIEIPNAIQGPGQSGGPVYHYKSQRIIGLVVKGYDPKILRNAGLAVQFHALFQKWPELEAINNRVAKAWDKSLPQTSTEKPSLLQRIYHLAGKTTASSSSTEQESSTHQVIEPPLISKIDQQAETILQTLTQLQQHFDLTAQLKPHDAFIQLDHNSLQLIQQVQTQLKQLPTEQAKYYQILILLGGLLATLGEQNNIEEAKACFFQVRDNSPNQDERALAAFNLFQLRLWYNAYASALEDLRIAIKIDPRYALHDIKQYPIEKLLGAGGMGCVFLCRSTNSVHHSERVVVKCFWESYKGPAETVFKQALAMNKVAGPYVPKPLGCGYMNNLQQEKAFLVTQYEDGMLDGATWLERKGALTPEIGIKVGLEVAKILQLAHCARVYHLDLKPSNILLKVENKKVTVKIINFGLAYAAVAIRQKMAKEYAAPEQLDPNATEKPSVQSDIYRFGVTLYHLLTDEFPRRISERNLPEIPQLRDILMRCLEQNITKRPESAQALVQEWLSLFPQRDVPKARTNLYYKQRCHLIGHRGAVWSVDFSPDGCTLASGGKDGAVRLWNIGMEEELCVLTGHSKAVTSVTYSPNGRLLASGSHDKTVKLWEVESKQVLQTVAHEEKIHTVRFNPTKRLFASADNNTTWLWEVETNGCKKWLELAACTALSFSFNGQYLALSRTEAIELINLKNPTKPKILSQNPAKVLAFSPDNAILVAGGHSINAWEVSTGRALSSLPTQDCEVEAIAFNDEGILAVNSNRGNIKLWNTQGHMLKALKSQGSTVCSLAFSPCGRFLAIGDEDKTVKLWERQ